MEPHAALRPLAGGLGALGTVPPGAWGPACRAADWLAKQLGQHQALLGLLVVLAAGKEDLGLQNFSLTQVAASGMWYEIALASNLEHQSSSPQRKVGAVIVEQDGPHLSLTSVSDHMNLCMKEKNQAVKGDAPGKFKIPLESGKEVIVVATDYKTYAIMNIILNRGGKPSSVLKLYREA
ncbi:epididymal-specific lipocalin-5-like [Bos mutus]|uniref:epididymal-specific lipocalin-5-like n=1 Tax=Bos mutus TaxID=72004 RepID=UPI0038B497D7